MSTAGAAAVVGTVLTSLQGAATQAASSAELQIDSAIENAKTTPTARQFESIFQTPLPDLRLEDFEQFDPTDLEVEYREERQRIATKLRSDTAYLLTEAFPVPHFGLMEQRIERALAIGEATLNKKFEQQEWERARSGVLQQSMELGKAAMVKWAARGYAVPPGGLVHEVHTIDRAAQLEIGKLSRTNAAAAFERELDTVRDAMLRAVELRKFAVSSALDYMRAYMTATEAGLDITKNTQAAFDRLRSTAYEFYSYLRTSQDWSIEVDKYNADELNKRERKEDEYQMRAITAAVNTLVARATALQSAASAAINGLRGEARVQGLDTTRIELE